MPFLTSALIGAGVAAAGSLGGAAISANAAGNAAHTQANAATQAAEVQQSDAAASLQAQEQALNLAEQNSAPYRAVGQNSLLALNDLMGLTPVNPYPINAGGNTAPTPALLNGTAATPGQINNQNAPPGPYPGAPVGPSNAAPAAPVAAPPAGAYYPTKMIPLAKGGPVLPRLTGLAQHYIVGEKGPEELTMFPNGTGWVTPNKGSLARLEGLHRAGGGPVRGPVATPNLPVQSVAGPGGPGVSSGSVGVPNLPPTPFGPGGTPPNSQQPYNPTWTDGTNGGNPLVTGGGGASSLNPFQPWTEQFQAPTIDQAENYPGYQFQLQQGEQALANSASASGELGDSNYGRALANYAENAAQSDYGNIYNQALGQYQMGYNIFQNNQSNQFNRLAALAGIGQTSTNQLNQGGYATGANQGNTLLQSGGQIGQNLNNIGAATASGYVGGANAWGGALGNISNTASQLPYLYQLMNSGGGGPVNGYQDPAGNMVYPPTQ